MRRAVPAMRSVCVGATCAFVREATFAPVGRKTEYTERKMQSYRRCAFAAARKVLDRAEGARRRKKRRTEQKALRKLQARASPFRGVLHGRRGRVGRARATQGGGLASTMMTSCRPFDRVAAA